MTPAQRIRKAALGPTPTPATLRSDWIGAWVLWEVSGVLGTGWGLSDFGRATDTQRRMFLLFVAEALENE